MVEPKKANQEENILFSRQADRGMSIIAETVTKEDRLKRKKQQGLVKEYMLRKK